MSIVALATMLPMLRSLRLAALAFLLLFVQAKVLVHPITHLPGERASETGLVAPHAAEACAECALLAGGFAALVASPPPPSHEAGAHALVFASYHSRAGEVPAWFQSRAPPVLL